MRKKQKKSVDPDGRRGREDLGGIWERRNPNQNILYEKNLFSIIKKHIKIKRNLDARK